MSLPDRNNPYSFEAFLNLLHDFDFYADDPFLQKTLKYFAGDEFVELDRKLREFSPKVSFRWRPLTDTGGNPNKLPYVEHLNAYNQRIDRIVRSAETLQLEKEIFAEGLFSSKVTAWESMAKRYLLHQLGEFGVMCPIACTEGLVALIKQFPEDHTPNIKTILDHCTEGVNSEFGIGAQFVSEIQGGSDIPSNLLEAVPEGNRYRLYGSKFFTSAIHADYAVVTAKISGSEDVGTFIVPAWMPGDKEKEIRNNFRKGISIFGGHGVIEDFCSLPRLFRDAAVNELWEGPRNVLLIQVFRDMVRAAEFYPADQFLGDLLSGALQTEIAELGRRAMEFAANPPFQKLDKGSRSRAVAWEEFIVAMFRVYQETALREVGPEPIIGSAKMSMPEIWR